LVGGEIELACYPQRGVERGAGSSHDHAGWGEERRRGEGGEDILRIGAGRSYRKGRRVAEGIRIGGE
jgi:hypothetical protein